MSKLLVVCGATGQQGGSVIDFVLNDSELSKQFKIRGITRDPSSSSAQSLQSKGVEVVAADVEDPASIQKAFVGAHTVFAMTSPDMRDTMASELRQGRTLVDAAVATDVQYYIFSTLPNVSKISGGKYTKVAGFDGKAITEEYIRTLPIRSAFFAPGSFMQNYHQIMKPRKGPDGTYSIARHVSPGTQLPMIDTAGDVGKWIGAILAEPDKFEGEVICAATKLVTMEEQAQILSKATGKEVVYKQLPLEVYKSFFPPAPYVDGLIEMMSYQEEFGYYGKDTESLVKWAADNARAKPTTFEEYLRKNPLVLD